MGIVRATTITTPGMASVTALRAVAILRSHHVDLKLQADGDSVGRSPRVRLCAFESVEICGRGGTRPMG